jgi:hypothetical protein
MKNYWLYFFSADRRITHVVEIDSMGDEEAIETLKAHVDGCAMELWQQARKVREFPAVSSH